MAKSSSIDLSKLSIEELESLAKDIETEVTTRRQAERERVLGQMRELAASLGLTLEDVVRLERGKGGAGGAQAKYRSPSDPSLTWSGRGKRPAWVNEALAAGKSLDDLAI
ncbi:MAG TPA: H-NS histone family protein [Thermoanaerobaculia bacterium]|jgi:DNA-binding protein H-NS|nr:H-NS histone family protein [Thermoanaerobaculia bacterium]